jgi:hypothetical protein
MVDQSRDLESECKIISSISLMNQNLIPYNKNQDLRSFNRQSEARNVSVLHPHIDVSRRIIKTTGTLKTKHIS